jgi:hypothetical protein
MSFLLQRKQDAWEKIRSDKGEYVNRVVPRALRNRPARPSCGPCSTGADVELQKRQRPDAEPAARTAKNSGAAIKLSKK